MYQTPYQKGDVCVLLMAGHTYSVLLCTGADPDGNLLWKVLAHSLTNFQADKLARAERSKQTKAA